MLRVCLCPRDLAREAWHQWYDAGDRSGKALLRNPAVKRLRPLLFNAVQSHGLNVDKEGLTFLRTAYLKEELRSSAFRSICREVLLLLEKEGFAPIVLKGAALAETVYPKPVLRHCHDIDILLPEDEMSRAAGLMVRLGFRTCSGPELPTHHLKMVHESELPLQFHSRLWDMPYYRTPISEIRARIETRDVAGVRGRILGVPDNLLHVCGHASYSTSRHSLRWVSDAWFIIKRYQDLDWDLLLKRADGSHLSLPIAVTLAYLAEDLNAPIPRSFFNRLFASASQTNVVGRDFALHGACSAPRGGVRNLLQNARDWRERAAIVKWALLPSPSYLSWARKIKRPWLLPLHYIARLVRCAVTGIWLNSVKCIKFLNFMEKRLFKAKLRAPSIFY